MPDEWEKCFGVFAMTIHYSRKVSVYNTSRTSRSCGCDKHMVPTRMRNVSQSLLELGPSVLISCCIYDREAGTRQNS